MDPTLIPRLAREAGLLRLSFILNHNREIAGEVMQLAALVAEQCAKVCEARAADHEESARDENDERFAVYAKHERRCAQAIREQFKEQP